MEQVVIRGLSPLFWDRGFSRRTIKALQDRIDAPERLLFATEEEIRRVPGIGKISLMNYRSRFIPAATQP
jgi:hypothetical protein